MISDVFILAHKTHKENYFHTSKKRLQAMKNKWKRRQAIFFTVMLKKGGKGKAANSTGAILEQSWIWAAQVNMDQF